MAVVEGNLRILLADDHVLVREGTRRILESVQGLVVVAEAGDGEEAVRLAGSCKPDLAIIDVSMPRMNGIEATRKIKELYPSIAVLVLTAYDNEEYIFQILEAGAAGYLLKTIGSKELIDSVRAIASGESVLHPSITRKLIEHFGQAHTGVKKEKLAEILSEREMAVLRLAARGRTNKQIAEELGLGLRTVEAHMYHVFDKLNVSSRTEAVVHAIREGWITLDSET